MEQHRIDLNDFLSFLSETGACTCVREQIEMWGHHTLEDIFDHAMAIIPYQAMDYLQEAGVIKDKRAQYQPIVTRKRGRIISSMSRLVDEYDRRWILLRKAYQTVPDDKTYWYMKYQFRMRYFTMPKVTKPCILQLLASFEVSPENQIEIVKILVPS